MNSVLKNKFKFHFKRIFNYLIKKKNNIFTYSINIKKKITFVEY